VNQMKNGKEIHPTIASMMEVWQADNNWVGALAVRAIRLGQFEAIVDTESGSLYAAKFWISEPKILPCGDLDDANSDLLCWIVGPEPLKNLHTYPWDFMSVLISGGIEETLVDARGSRFLAYRERITTRSSSTLAKINSVAPDTWTFLKTGDRAKDVFQIAEGKILRVGGDIQSKYSIASLPSEQDVNGVDR